MGVADRKSLKVFCSYSHRDEEHLNDLRDSLSGLEREGLIEWWHDRKIVPGWEWNEAIDKHLRTADVVLLLVSRAFMASDYVYEKEIGVAVERHERGEARVIPIIVRPADWEWASFGKLQALPTDAKPITRWSDPDDAWLDVVRGVRKSVEELLLERQKQAVKERYRKAVEKIWVDKWVSTADAERLSNLASELALSVDTGADIEREVMDDTLQAILQRQARIEEERRRHLKELYTKARRLYRDQEWRAVIEVFEQIHAQDPDYPDPKELLTSAREALELARKEDALRQYREGVEAAWTDRELNRRDVEVLRDLADQHKVSPSDSAKTEREVMGETKEAILERLERAAKERERKERERKERLDKLYARARRLHQDKEWQAVIDVFQQIHSEEPAHPDAEGILESAREGLKLKQKVAETYDRGLRHVGAEEWPQALECFEEVQQLEPGYRDTEKLLARVLGELPKSSTRWEYTDFDLEIGQQREPRKYSVAARSLGGEAQGEMHFPFDEWELKDKLRDLEVALLRSGGTRRSIDTSEEKAVQEFGQALFDALLVGDVRTRYEVSLREARRQHKGLRLKLHVQPSELSALPWEFLYDSERDYLGLSSMTPLVRYLDVPQSVERLTVTLPLRILGLVASPKGLPQLNVRREKRLLEEAVKGLREKGLVELTWLEGQTWRDLQRSMRREEDWHILHFIGHGGFDAETEEGAIALADDVGSKDLLRATSLARLLDDHYALRLVFLNSCEGAKGSESDAFSSTAATLVRRGVPAVVAMQYEVTDKAAIEFSRDFYEAVADGLPVDAAVAEARTAVSMKSALEWGTPVLYMRSPDGRIFDVQQTVDRPGEIEPKFRRFKTLPGWEPESTTSFSFEKDTSARFVMSEREDEPIRFECSEFQADIPIKHTHMLFVYAKRQDFEPIQVGTHESVEWWWFRGDFYKVEFEPGRPSAYLAAELAADETYADKTSLLDTLLEEGYSPDEVAEGVIELKGETETALESAERLDTAKAITNQAVEVSRLNELLAVQDTSHDLGLEKDESARVYVEKSWRRTQVYMESDLHQPRQVLVDNDTMFKLIPELQNYHPILLDKHADSGRLSRPEVVMEWWCFKGDIYLAKREKGYQSEALSLLKEATSRTHLIGKSQAWIPKWTIGNEFEDLYEEGYAPEEVVRLILALEGKRESLEEMFKRVQAAKDTIDEASNFRSAFQAAWDATRDWFKRELVEEYLQERKLEGSEGLREAREGGYWFHFKEWDRRRS